MIRRIVNEVNFQARPIDEFDQSFQKLSSRARILRTVIQINRQSPDLRKLVLHAGPPCSQTVAPEVACFVMSEDQRQRSGQQNQDTERNQFLFCRRIMIPRFGDVSFAVGPCFPPPASIHPD